LTGSAVFEDGQMYNTARLVLAFIRSAVSKGATAANYTQEVRFLWDKQSVRGVRALDRLANVEFDIRAKLVLNAAGPWADYLLQDTAHFGPRRRGHFSRDACFLVNRKPRSAYAWRCLAGAGIATPSSAVRPATYLRPRGGISR
jgi:glycerol-3-phosphate dehydrogenase